MEEFKKADAYRERTAIGKVWQNKIDLSMPESITTKGQRVSPKLKTFQNLLFSLSQ